MAGVNKVILVGNVGKDPDVHYTADGKAIANLTMATSESWKDKNTGQKQEKTEWHRVVFFGGLATIVAEYIKKGSKIYVEGKLTTRKWQDNTGADRYTTEIIVDFGGTMQMLDSAGGGNQPGQQGYADQGQQNQQNNNQQGQQRAPQGNQQGYGNQGQQNNQQGQQRAPQGNQQGYGNQGQQRAPQGNQQNNNQQNRPTQNNPGGNTGGNQGYGGGQQNNQQGAGQQRPFQDEFDDDIPF